MIFTIEFNVKIVNTIIDNKQVEVNLSYYQVQEIKIFS